MYRTLTQKQFNRFDKRKRSKILFYCLLMIIPVAQVAIFYFYINFNSIIMAFQQYGYTTGYNIGVTGWGFENFSLAWKNFTEGSYRLRNTLLFFAISLFIDVPLALFSSYYLFKKRFAHGFFKVLLFMPQIISSMILAMIFRALCGDVYKELVLKITGEEALFGLLDNPNSVFFMVVLFNLIMSFGVNVLIYTGAMSGVNQSLIESSELDGCNSFRTFIHVIFPMIFPTISTLLVISVSCLFVNQFQTYSLIGEAGDAHVDNIGFYLYVNSLNSSLKGEGSFLSYPVLAAYGLILTAFILPTSLLIRWLLNKFGPSTK